MGPTILKIDYILIIIKTIFTFFVLPLRVDAVIIEDHSACSQIFQGRYGEIKSPDYPLEYPDNLGCVWTIKTSENFRIELNFLDFELEKSAECFDKLTIKDGAQDDAPTLEIFCGDDGKGKTVTSSGNALYLQFLSDESLGERGIYILWKEIEKLSLESYPEGFFNEPWVTLDVPANLIDFDSGVFMGSLWTINNNYDVFYYDSNKWSIIPGKLKSISVNQAGIFGIDSKNSSIYWRHGISVNNQKGDLWKLVSKNKKRIQRIESTNYDYIYGIDDETKMYYAHVRDIDILDEKWQPFVINVENNVVPIDSNFRAISCGSYSCWIVMLDGSVYSSKTFLGTNFNPNSVIWTVSSGQFKDISAGFGNNIWALMSNGDVYKKNAATSHSPMGGDWQKQNLQLDFIHAGIGGVYGFKKDKGFGEYKEVCGGILYENKGTILSPNYPSTYPASTLCLWIIKPADMSSIDVSFDFQVFNKDHCNDFLLIGFPGMQEQDKDCGGFLRNKRIESNELHIEFFSDHVNEDGKFKIIYEAKSGVLKTPSTFETLTPVFQGGWKRFTSTFGLEGITNIIESTKVSWFFTSFGKLYMSKKSSNDLLNLVMSGVKSVATDNKRIYIINSEGHIMSTLIDKLPLSEKNWVKHPFFDVAKPKSMFVSDDIITVLTEENTLLTSPLSDFNFKKIKLPFPVNEAVSHPYLGTFVVRSSFPPISYFIPNINNPLNYMPISNNFKQFTVTQNGQIYGLQTDGRIALWEGMFSDSSFDNWKVLNDNLFAERIFSVGNDVYLEDSNGEYLVRLADEINDILLIEEKKGEDNFIKLYKVENPTKIDTYPRENKIDIWILGGEKGQTPYYGIFDPISSNFKIEKMGNFNFFDLSVGESGVWAIEENTGTPYHYLHSDNKWLKVSSNFRAKIIESASPAHTVYAIEDSENKLYLRNGISPQNPLGTDWTHIPVKVKSILSTPLKTYVKMVDDKWQMFYSSAIQSDLYSWISSWEKVKWDTYSMSKVSAGFDGSVVYASRNGLHNFKQTSELNNQDYLLNSQKVVDFSAGPVIFAIVGQYVYSKTISSCFGFYEKTQTLTLNHLQKPTSVCTWLVTSSDKTDMEISFETNQNSCTSVVKVFTGAIIYNENKICAPFQSQDSITMEGGRAYIEYKKMNTALPSDTFQLKFSKRFKMLPNGWKVTVPGYFSQLFSFFGSEMWLYNDKSNTFYSVNKNFFIPKPSVLYDIQSMAFGWDGIYFLKKDGSVNYLKGFGPQFSESVQISPKVNNKRDSIVVGPQHIFIIENKDVFWKDTTQSVDGSFTYFTSNVDDISEDENGVWVVKSGNLQFYEHKKYTMPKIFPLNSAKISRVFSGNGKVFILADDEIYERTGVNIFNPHGNDFKKIGLSHIIDSKINKNGIFVLLADGRLINKEETPCGGYMTLLNKETLTYPEVASQYTENQHCVWYIKIDKEKELKINQVNFNLEKSEGCLKDSVIIKSLSSNLAPLVLCGDGLDRSVQISSNKIAVEFNSDSNINGNGFKFIFDAVTRQEVTATTPALIALPLGWGYMSPPNKKFISISASIESSSLWAVDDNGFPHVLDKDSWIVPQSGKPSENLQISPGVSGVYAMDKNDNIFFKNHFINYWTQMQNNKKTILKLTYGANNEIIAISKDGEVLSRQEITDYNPFGESWKLIENGYSDVSVSFYGYWLIDKKGNIYFSTYIPSSNLLKKLLTNKIEGNFLKVVSGFGGNVWALNNQNEIFRRLNVNSLNPSGVSWEKISGLKVSDIAAGYDGIYALDMQGRVIGSKEFHCGGIYFDQTGSFSSPGYPKLISSNQNCLYIIRAPPGFSSLEVNFKDFELEESESCHKNYLLALLDGRFPSKYTSKNCATKVTSLKFGDRAWYEFFSEKKNQKRGFSGSWVAKKEVETTPVNEVNSILTFESSTTKQTTVIPQTTTTVPDGPLFRDCGGNIAGQGGIIVHPNYPQQYSNNQNCNYVITVDQNKVIEVTFDELDLENSAKCDYDFVEIKDKNDGRVQRYCQKGPNMSFKSSGRKLQIQFYSDEIGLQKGFRIRWRAVSDQKLDCFFSQTGNNGEIISPNYPGEYENNLDCFWNITVNKNKIVEVIFRELNIESMNVESGLTCFSDFIKLTDDIFQKEIGKFCGSRLPDLIQSSGNAITIHFHTDNQKTGKGFRLIWRAQDMPPKTTSKPVNEYVLNIGTDSESTEISSPNYPERYETKKDLYWRILGDTDQKIQLSFLHMDIESGPKCKYDYLQIRDFDASGAILGTFCGRNLPQPIVSTSNQLFIHFHSDDQQTRTGFKLSLKAIQKITTPVTTTTTTPVTTTTTTPVTTFATTFFKKRVFEYDLTGITGEITSPNYPEKYEIDQDYYWNIVVEPDSIIQITFFDFKIESGENCKYDYLQIKENEGGIDLGKFCGSILPQPIKSRSNKILIHFHSDDQQTRAGFKLKWLGIKNTPIQISTLPIITTPSGPKKVEYVINENDGEIVSPNYPLNYNINEDYYWKIEVKFGLKVQLQFVVMNVESGNSCQYDYIQVRDGRDNSGKDLGRYCGTEEPVPLTSNSNRMFIHFHSDGQETRKGFILRWTGVESANVVPTTKTTTNKVQITTAKVFEFELIDSDGEIVSPNYPNNYDADQDYYWKISVNPNKRIMLSFISMDIESETNCNYDYIQVRDGRDIKATELGKFCGNQEPSSLMSTGNRMFVHFHSDKQQTRKGFILQWKAIDATITPILQTTVPKKVFQYELNDPEGEIISSNFPHEYDVDKDYFWRILVNPNKRILLSFQYMDVESSANCEYDYIQIIDGRDKIGNVLGKYCGNQEPKPLLSTANQMFIHFHSNKQYARKGFILKWKAVDIIETKPPNILSTIASTLAKKVFEFNLTESEGEVISPNYPNNYDVSKDFYWKITVKPNQKIQLFFLFLEIEFAFTCSHDYIQITDGSGDNLGKFCGTQKPDMLMSLGNQVVVHFHSDDQQTRKGFILRWKAVDALTTSSPATTLKKSPNIQEVFEYTLMGSNGEIKSSNYPRNYKINQDYYWTINAEPNEIVRLSFIAVDIETSSNCDSDYIIIRDGESNDKIIGKYCGQILPDPISSSGNRMFVHFHSNEQYTKSGFRIKWEALPKFGPTTTPVVKVVPNVFEETLYGSSGEIRSSKYPRNYEINEDYYWTIIAEPHEVIRLSFIAVDIETSYNCGNDYIMIRDGESSDKVLGKYCGQTIPDAILSSGNRMFVHFHSNEQYTKSGFRLKWETLPKLKLTTTPVTKVVPKVFEETLYESNGEIRSSKYPRNYEINQDYYWTIIAEPHEVIRLSFIAVDIETSSNCDSDYIMIRDGESSDKVLGKYCGQTLPDAILSSGNRMFVHFHSNEQYTKSGFRLKWEALPKLKPTTTPVTKVVPKEFEETLYGSNGEIRSLKYPRNYEINQDFYWKIIAEPYEVIRLSFIDIDIETSSNCDNDYIMIRDGESSDKVLGKYCGQTLPDTILSSGNRMFVHFHSNEQYTKSGFRLKWETLPKLKPTTTPVTKVVPKVFEETLYGSNGEIRSLKYPRNYEVNQDYYWTIIAEPNEIIRLSFIAVDIETSSNCDNDYIIIRDGESSDKVLGKYCGQTLPDAILSSGNRMFVHFHSNEQYTKSGFRLKWETLPKLKPTTTPVTKVVPKVFEETLFGSNGEIRSLKYPRNYEVNQDYYWTIIAEPNEIIRLSFIAVDIETSYNCGNDYIMIRDGESSDKVLGKYCGQTLPDAILSSGNRMFVHFHSNEQYTKSGFRLKWETLPKLKPTTTPVTKVVPKVFEYTLTGKNGEIRSANYPRNYDVNQEFYWTINVEPSEIIRLSFVSFNIEPSTNCIHDYIIIKDGKYNGYILGRFCGVNFPNTLLSSGNHMHIQFHSNDRITNSGFLLRWNALNKLKPIIVPTPPNNVIVLTERNGEIKSFNYPNNYDDNSDFYWLIKGQPDEEIKLNFIDMDIEESEYCFKDYILILDGFDFNGIEIGKFCGQQFQSKTSIGNQVFVHFHSDSHINKRGFRLLYAAQKVTEEPKTIPKVVENDLFGNNGQILSPNYPKNYNLLQDFYWKVTVSENKVIKFKFYDMDLENGENCPYDFIQIRDGGSIIGNILGRFCGQAIPPDIFTSGKTAHIQFHSDDRLTKKGFKLMWEAVQETLVLKTTAKTTASQTATVAKECNFVLTTSNGVITSPNYPNHYPKNKDCYWLIVAEIGKVIILDFVDFDVESGGECSYDFLNIYDGENYFSKKIGAYCGNNIQVSAQSTGNQMYLHFRSDDRQTRKGFMLRWNSMAKELITKKPFVVEEVTTTKPETTTTSTPSKLCRYKMYGRSGMITSPNFPNNYSPNQDCNWYLTSPEGTLIVLTFIEIDIEPAGDCYYDYLIIRDGLKSSSPLLGRFCGNNRVPDIRSTSNKVLLNFYSDDRNSYKGFVLKWYAEKIGYLSLMTTSSVSLVTTTTLRAENCDKLFTSTQGQFFHRDYPYSYRSNENCIYKIQSPRNYRIVFYFTLFDLELSENCQKDYIEIFDGTKDDEKQLGRFCGSKAPSTIRTNSNLLNIKFVTDNSYERAGFVFNYFFELRNELTPKSTASQFNVDTTAIINRVSTTGTREYKTDITSKSGKEFSPLVGTPQATTKSKTRTQTSTDNFLFTGLSDVHNYYFEYEGESGVLMHPNYPDKYMNNMQSFWTIRTPPSTVVVLSFTLFDLEPSVSCDADYLAVYDGVSTSSPLIEKRCSYSANQDIETSDNKMLVVFHSNDKISKRGFLATWKSKKRQFSYGGYDSSLDICSRDPLWHDSQFSRKRILLISPTILRKSTTCMQQFMISPSQIFKIEFLTFNLSVYSMECLDYLSIYDGIKISSKEIGKFCGTHPPNVLYTTGNILFIELGYFEERFAKTVDFKLVISAIDKSMSFGIFTSKHKCGEVVRANSGTISSIDAVNSQHPICVWIIETKPSTRIKYFFSNFYLTDVCDSSYVILRDGDTSDSTKVARYCDKSMPSPAKTFLSSSNRLWIEYKGSSNFFGQFSLVWEEQAVTEFHCGGLVTGEGGYLSSPFYPQKYENELSCIWNVVVETGRRIAVTVENMQLHSDCSRNYVLMRDGSSSEGNVLKRHCVKPNLSEVLSTSNSMWIELKTSCFSNTLFNAFWKAVKV
ncbi:cubilin isoform X2 [Hydra vulgaris]|uniref:cubilin isoform X2 n=1 Tax=Hydra vulgaris TaxID=6087 RepID=UPI0032E9F7A3